MLAELLLFVQQPSCNHSRVSHLKETMNDSGHAGLFRWAEIKHDLSTILMGMFRVSKDGETNMAFSQKSVAWRFSE